MTNREHGFPGGTLAVSRTLPREHIGGSIAGPVPVRKPSTMPLVMHQVGIGGIVTTRKPSTSPMFNGGTLRGRGI